MSQQQPRSPIANEPIKYGDVFEVSRELADKPIAPQNASMMQSAGNFVLGTTVGHRPAAVMESAATPNERSGFVGHTDLTDIVGDEGVTLSKSDLPKRGIVTESVTDQVVGQYSRPAPLTDSPTSPVSAGKYTGDLVTIGEALEAAALTAGDKPVHHSDAAAVQAAEMRATCQNVTTPGGVAAAAQSAAAANAGIIHSDQKTKLADVLTDATMKMPVDKVATQRDVEAVKEAELQNNPAMMVTHPVVVSASVAAAARLNQQNNDVNNDI